MRSPTPTLGGITGLVRKPYWRGILARVRWPMHTGQLEGIKNWIKMIKYMAYGYSHINYFFLNIKTTFPENAW